MWKKDGEIDNGCSVFSNSLRQNVVAAPTLVRKPLTSLMFQSHGHHGTLPRGAQGQSFPGGLGSPIWASPLPKGFHKQTSRPHPECGPRIRPESVPLTSPQLMLTLLEWGYHPEDSGLHMVPTPRLRGDSGQKHIIATGGAPQGQAPCGRSCGKHPYGTPSHPPSSVWLP